MRRGDEFFNFHNHDFVRLAVAVPRVRVADPEFNAGQTIELIGRAAELHAAIVLFPELGLSAYSCEDLFHQKALLNSALAALERIREESRSHALCVVAGVPLQIEHLLYNCAVVMANGRILGAIPKTYLPNYRELYEERFFASGNTAPGEIELLGSRGIPFGNRLLFRVEHQPLLTFFVEICEDLWVRFRHRATPRSPAPRCCSICPPRISRLRKRTTGGS